MRSIVFIFCMMLSFTAFTQTSKTDNEKKFVLVIHGGAGTILKKNMSPEYEKAYTTALDSALKAGYAILSNGGTSLDAITAAIKVMEDCPLFNAGKGAVFTNEGKNELDAAIMDGQTLKAGSVAGVTTIKNPITAARAVMEKSEHVIMAGKGAEKFAGMNGCTIVDPSYFYTKERWYAFKYVKTSDSLLQEFNRVKESLHRTTDSFNQKMLKYDINSADSLQTELKKSKPSAFLKQPNNHDYKYGTVGAVALDIHGNLAAGTSTGGMTNKKYGRIGDAPIIGAGTYADNNTCAISCTGWGEYFIRLVMAKSIADRMEFGKMSLVDAANEMVMKKLPALGGDGGLIAVDKDGNITLPFCTEGMYRGYIRSTGEKAIKIYKD
jgi:beta-aspartyl-peptidase (threonine type)